MQALISLVFFALIQTAYMQTYTECGHTYTEKQFIIESSGYPRNYPINFECLYHFKGPLMCSTRFDLHFLDFVLEESESCTKDRFEIENQQRICGTANGTKSFFSKNGTLTIKLISDQEKSAKGFKILVSRSECLEQTETVTEQSVPKWNIRNNDVEFTGNKSSITPKRVFTQPDERKNCCNNEYSEKKFTLASPNFPYTLSTNPTDCVYTIRKNNPDICRLRLHVQFFWLGEQTPSHSAPFLSSECKQGYLQIDGKYLCGCNADLNLVSPFGEGGNYKILSFVLHKLELKNTVGGFVVDVFQDACPKRFAASNCSVKMPENYKTKNRIAFPASDVNELRLVGERLINNDPDIVKHIYFFTEDYGNEMEDEAVGNGLRDVEEITYLETNSAGSIISSKNLNYCRVWNRNKLGTKMMENLQTCEISQIANLPSDGFGNNNCIVLGSLRGFFKSPGYPYFYPGNLNLCYRFQKQPGYCSFRILMQDFAIENSRECLNDYLQLPNQLRYCGNNLHRTMLSIDLTYKYFDDIRFNTDAFFCNRGFFATYEQIACDMISEIPRLAPIPARPIPPMDMHPNTPQIPLTPCRKLINEPTFVLEINEPLMCTFVIRKSNQNVCKVNLYFEQFDLPCTSQSLIIDGTKYCGRLTGQSVTINNAYRDQIIIYNKRTSHDFNFIPFRIQGFQITQGCAEPEVPAQFKYATKARDNTAAYFFKIHENFKDACGIIYNNNNKTRQENLSKTEFCELLRNSSSKNFTECVPLDVMIITERFAESQYLEVNLGNTTEVQILPFRKVSCNENNQYLY